MTPGRRKIFDFRLWQEKCKLCRRKIPESRKNTFILCSAFAESCDKTFRIPFVKRLWERWKSNVFPANLRSLIKWDGKTSGNIWSSLKHWRKNENFLGGMCWASFLAKKICEIPITVDNFSVQLFRDSKAIERRFTEGRCWAKASNECQSENCGSFYA